MRFLACIAWLVFAVSFISAYVVKRGQFDVIKNVSRFDCLSKIFGEYNSTKCRCPSYANIFASLSPGNSTSNEEDEPYCMESDSIHPSCFPKFIRKAKLDGRRHFLAMVDHSCKYISNISIWNILTQKSGTWIDMTANLSSYFQMTRNSTLSAILSKQLWKGQLVMIRFDCWWAMFDCVLLKFEGLIEYPFDLDMFRYSTTKPSTEADNRSTKRSSSANIPTTHVPTTNGRETKLPTSDDIQTTYALTTTERETQLPTSDDVQSTYVPVTKLTSTSTEPSSTSTEPSSRTMFVTKTSERKTTKPKKPTHSSEDISRVLSTTSVGKSSTPRSPMKKKGSIGLIIGIVMGIVALIIVVILIVYICLRKSSNDKKKNDKFSDVINAQNAERMPNTPYTMANRSTSSHDYLYPAPIPKGNCNDADYNSLRPSNDITYEYIDPDIDAAAHNYESLESYRTDVYSNLRNPGERYEKISPRNKVATFDNPTYESDSQDVSKHPVR